MLSFSGCLNDIYPIFILIKACVIYKATYHGNTRYTSVDIQPSNQEILAEGVTDRMTCIFCSATTEIPTADGTDKLAFKFCPAIKIPAADSTNRLVCLLCPATTAMPADGTDSG